MIDRSIKGKLLVFSVFFLGIVSGVVITNLWETRLVSAPVVAEKDKEKRADRDVNQFYDYVGMTAAQREQAKKIMSDSRPEIKKIIDQTRPQMDAIQKQTRSQIRAILTDEQKKKYDEFNEARRNKQRPQRSN